MDRHLLGGRTAATFLKEYWQKRPLLIRGAVPGFAGLVDRNALCALAGRDDVTSRLVIDHGGPARTRWERHDGPFPDLDPSALPETPHTLLVHGVESLIDSGWSLLRRFDFIPAARVDDLMVSYASRGGSVGPHVDSYDVFLLQGPGRRRWRISAERDPELDARAAIKVLKRFRAEEEWILEAGDMLYLPPGVPHHGIAEEPCYTYSVGFLAPTDVELTQAFLGWLGGVTAASLDPEAIYADPNLRAARAPLELADELVGHAAKVLARLRWDRRAVEDFLGAFLTRPRPNARFLPPSKPISAADWARRLRGRGDLGLALPSRGLTRRDRVYLNGEARRVRPPTRALFTRLVRERALPLPLDADEEARGFLYDAYRAGWLDLRR